MIRGGVCIIKKTQSTNHLLKISRFNLSTERNLTNNNNNNNNRNNNNNNNNNNNKKYTTHRAEVVPLEFKKHPSNSDFLVASFYGNSTCVAADDFSDGNRYGIYISPDCTVSSNFSKFLETKCPYTKHFHLRNIDNNKVVGHDIDGLWSNGILLPAPIGSTVGDDLSDSLGIERNDEAKSELHIRLKGYSERLPASIIDRIYQIETFWRYVATMRKGERIIITEKIHGVNARYCWGRERMYCGSKKEWKIKDTMSVWWNALQQNEWIESFCKANPTLMLYGEVFGDIQNLSYGLSPNNYKFVVFDILNLKNGRWLSMEETQKWRTSKEIIWAPIIYDGPFRTGEEILKTAERESMIEGANHFAEGIVVVPYNNRMDPEIGRIKLKVVSDTFIRKIVCNNNQDEL